MGHKIDYIGKKFGRLTPIEIQERDKTGRKKYLCLCDCGNKKAVWATHLQKGATRSCGCLNAEMASKHCKKMNPTRRKSVDELVSKRAKNENQRYHNDAQFRIKKLYRGTIDKGIKLKRRQDVYRDEIGCTFREYRDYIEFLFKPGMTWDNKGEWEIDHKIPLFFYDLTNEKQRRIAFNFRNTEVLWKSEHVAKSRMDHKIRCQREKTIEKRQLKAL